MGQDFGGQGTPGGANFDEIRRRMGGVPQQGGTVGPRPMQPGGATPRPPGGPSAISSPVQLLGPGAPVGVNPYDQPDVLKAQGPTPQGGTDVAAAPRSPTLNTEKWAPPQTPVKPGAPIGPAPAAPPQVSQTAQPTPQNPSPNGPSRAQPGSAIKPVVGAPQGGGSQQPNWGLPRAASRFQRADRNPPQAPQSNMPANPYGPPMAAAPGGPPDPRGGGGGNIRYGGAPSNIPAPGATGEATKDLLAGLGAMSYPTAGNGPSNPGGRPPTPQGGPGMPRRSVYGDQPGGGGGGVSV